MKPNTCICVHSTRIEHHDGTASSLWAPDPGCSLCGGTGNVWPSVEGESVHILPGVNSSREAWASGFAGALRAMKSTQGLCIIVQPLPSPDERGESEPE